MTLTFHLNTSLVLLYDRQVASPDKCYRSSLINLLLFQYIVQETARKSE